MCLCLVQVCHTLLPTLVHRKPLCRRIISLPSWQALAAAFARREAALTTHLSQKFQRALSRSLCLAASGFSEEAPAQQYVSQLMLQTVNEVVGLAGQQQLPAVAQRADVQLQVCTPRQLFAGSVPTHGGASFCVIKHVWQYCSYPLILRTLQY